jgi:hypothetical protein
MALAPKQDDGRQRALVGLAQRLAEKAERLGRGLVSRRQIVGLLEKDRVDLGPVDEALDVHGLVGDRNEGFDLFGLEQQIFILVDLVALHLLVGLDRLPGLLVDIGRRGSGS